MLKKTITYTDFSGNTRTEDFYFNLTKAEVIEMELTSPGGYVEMLNRIVNSGDPAIIMKTFKEIITKSYGVKSPDGRTMVKTEAALQDFMATEAYSDLYLELCTNADSAAAFIEAVLPKDLKTAADKIASNQHAIAPVK